MLGLSLPLTGSSTLADSAYTISRLHIHPSIPVLTHLQSTNKMYSTSPFQGDLCVPPRGTHMPNLCGSTDCSLVIIDLKADIHIQVNILCISLSESGLLHSGWFFSTSIHSTYNLMMPFSSSWVTLHCVNVLHYLYPFFSWRTSGLFPTSGCYEQSSNKDGRESVLVVDRMKHLSGVCWRVV